MLEKIAAWVVSCDYKDCQEEMDLCWSPDDARDEAIGVGWEEVEEDIFICPRCAGRIPKKGK